MSWSYSGDPSTSPLDQIRFTIGDTQEGMPLIQDEEIFFVLDKYNQDVQLASIHCLEGIVIKLAGQVDYTIGPEHVAAGNRYKNYLANLERLKKDLTKGYTAPINTGPTGPSCFDIGMNDYK